MDKLSQFGRDVHIFFFSASGRPLHWRTYSKNIGTQNKTLMAYLNVDHMGVFFFFFKINSPEIESDEHVHHAAGVLTKMYD